MKKAADDNKTKMVFLLELNLTSWPKEIMWKNYPSTLEYVPFVISFWLYTVLFSAAVGSNALLR